MSTIDKLAIFAVAYYSTGTIYYFLKFLSDGDEDTNFVVLCFVSLHLWPIDLIRYLYTKFIDMCDEKADYMYSDEIGIMHSNGKYIKNPYMMGYSTTEQLSDTCKAIMKLESKIEYSVNIKDISSAIYGRKLLKKLKLQKKFFERQLSIAQESQDKS